MCNNCTSTSKGSDRYTFGRIALSTEYLSIKRSDMEWQEVAKRKMEKEGFVIVDDIFTIEEVAQIVHAIESVTANQPAFRKATELFAIRRFLKEIPAVKELLFTSRLCEVITSVFGTDYFVVKSIYFDKPPASNWFVAWHQDLTIAVDKRVAIDGFGPWTVKGNQFAVQPPLAFLEDNFTVRIHLDDTDECNGALRVIPASHKQGIVRPETIDKDGGKEMIGNVKRGGIMLMRPLLFHASAKTVSNRRRRVIHIECSKRSLPPELQWPEYEDGITA